MNPVIRDLQTAVIVAEEIGMKGSCLIGIMLHEIVKAHILSIEDVNTEYGEDVGSIIKGLVKTNELYSKSPAIESEEFPQPSPVICRRYACDPDYDCRPCERNAPD